MILCFCMLFCSFFVDCWWFHSMFAFESLTTETSSLEGQMFQGGGLTYTKSSKQQAADVVQNLHVLSSLGSSGSTIITGEYMRKSTTNSLTGIVNQVKTGQTPEPMKIQQAFLLKKCLFSLSRFWRCFFLRGGGGERRQRCDPHRLGQPGATRFYVDEDESIGKKQNQSYVKFVFLYFNT